MNVRMPESGTSRYEPASPNVVAAAGLLVAVKELTTDEIAHRLEHEKKLTEYLVDEMRKIPGIRLYLAPAQSHVGIVAFNLAGYKASDIGMILDADYNIAVRTGYHCAPLIHKFFNEESMVRLSFSAENTFDEIDIFINALKSILEEKND